MEPVKTKKAPIQTQAPAKEIPASLRRMREAKQAALAGGPPARVEAQRKKGKLTARERIQYLLDENSFHEVDMLRTTRALDYAMQDKKAPGDGVVTGFGTIAGRNVAVFSQDFTQLGGSLGLEHAKKICKIMDMAYESRIPVLGILDSGGARIQEGVDSLDGYGMIFERNVKCSGVIPQISIILGPCAGGAVYSPALTDFVFMVRDISNMFVTGPTVVKAATGEEVDMETLGGASAHASKSGVCHVVANSEPDCFRRVRDLMSYLPASREERAPRVESNDNPNRRTPLFEKFLEIDPRKPYRVHHVIWRITDDHKFFEVHHDFAKNICVGFARMGGDTVGIVANNPAHMAGALDIHAAEKAARFIRFCDAFNIPLVTLVDVPGYWPGVDQEHGGIIRHGAKLLYAYAEATVPKVTVTLRKAYGGAYIAMSSKYMKGDFNFAFPCAEIAVMGSRGAIEILNSREIKAAKDPEALKQTLSAEYAAKFAAPYQVASTGSIDEIIEPATVRPKIIRSLEVLKKKRVPGQRPNHGNIPL